MRTLRIGLFSLLAGAAALVGYDRIARAREQKRGALPGDDTVRNPQIQATHTISIDARRENVWPWLVQMGYERAGWYIDAPWWRAMIGPAMTALMHEDERARVEPTSFDSADQILNQYQHPSVGDTIPDGPPGTAAFTIVQLEKDRLLALHSNSELRMIIPHQLRGRLGVDGEFGWAFVLESTPTGGCTLTSRIRIRLEPAWLHTLSPLFRVADARVQRAMLAGIKRRAEAWERGLTSETPEEEEADGWQTV